MNTDDRLPCFVAMPFARDFSIVYERVIKPLFEESHFANKYVCWRADKERKPGRITDQIIKQIRDCAFVIADITGYNANVMYEIGYAHALCHPTIIINQYPPESSPFDIKDYRQITYKMDGLNVLKSYLLEAVRNITPDLSRWHIRCLKYGSPEEQIKAARWLGDHGNIEAVDALLRAFDIPIPRLRKEVEKALVKLGTKSSEFAEKISEGMIAYLSEDDIKNIIKKIVEMNPDQFKDWDISNLDNWKLKKK